MAERALMNQLATDELIQALRAWAAAFRVKDGMSQLTKDLAAAADRLEEQEKIINQYHRVDTFLNAHGWKWRDEEDDHR